MLWNLADDSCLQTIELLLRLIANGLSSGYSEARVL